MIRVADYVIKKLADEGVRHAFVVTGGGAMFLNNAFAHEPRIASVCNHHEQASAMAAEGYARTSGKLGVINVTTGPGGINSLNGVFGAWTDSIPMLIVSGQVKRETCLAAYDLPGLRQLGDQEVDIIRMVKGITKYATLVMDPQTIRYHLEKALYLATHGRPGPCWLDIPVDVQSTMIDPDTLAGYDPREDRLVWDVATVTAQCREVLRRLQTAARPVIMAGTGVRLAGAMDVFERVVNKLGIPVTTAWTHDLIESDSPLFCGRPGTIGDRAGNFTVQNSDALLILGSRLNIRQISYNWKAFARHAFKMQVDVDDAELHKPTLCPEMGIHCDAKVFLEELERQIDAAKYDPRTHADWLAWCKVRVARYPVVLAKHRNPDIINPYHFIDALYRQLDEDDVVVCGNATACIVTYQVATIKKGQRLLSNSGSASMGWDLPAAIGAAVAQGGKRVICLAGDGSLQMNVQELQTLAHHRFPIKVFVLSNGGYLSIRTTQINFFGKRFGEGPESGVSLPDIVQLAGAYGLPAVRLARPPFDTVLKEILSTPGPMLCDVVLDQSQTFEPKLSSKQLPDGRMVSAPLEDMFPFLDKDELATNLLIPSEG